MHVTYINIFSATCDLHFLGIPLVTYSGPVGTLSQYGVRLWHGQAIPNLQVYVASWLLTVLLRSHKQVFLLTSINLCKAKCFTILS